MIASFDRPEHEDPDPEEPMAWGAVFHFKGILGKPQEGHEVWVHRPGHVRLVGVCTHTQSQQRLVVYSGLDGNRFGKMFCCTLIDWERYFEVPAAEPQLDSTPVRMSGTRVAGKIDPAWGMA